MAAEAVSFGKEAILQNEYTQITRKADRQAGRQASSQFDCLFSFFFFFLFFSSIVCKSPPLLWAYVN